MERSKIDEKLLEKAIEIVDYWMEETNIGEELEVKVDFNVHDKPELVSYILSLLSGRDEVRISSEGRTLIIRENRYV